MVCVVLGLLAAGYGGASSQPAAPPLYLAQQVAQRILGFQTPDGAIAMDPASPARNTRVVPYVANYAAMGLVAVYAATHRTPFAEGALKWVRWYEAHMNPDGTIDDWAGSGQRWQSTNNRDSTDAYAATYLSLVERIFMALHDRRWLSERRPFVERAVGAIRLTLQPNGLTTAKPDWPVMYTMDNVETASGLRSAATLAEAAGWKELRNEAARLAQSMEHAIQAVLWDTSSSTFLVGVQTDGARVRAGSDWYPSVMANLMAAAWLPGTERTVQLFRRLYQQYRDTIPAAAATADDATRLIWWTYAASKCGTQEQANDLARRVTVLAAHPPAGCYPDALGHICILLVDGMSGRAHSSHSIGQRERPSRRRSYAADPHAAALLPYLSP